jgi:carboxypeptidase T
MFKLLLSLIVAALAATPVLSADNPLSFDRLLSEVTSVQAEIPLAPVADKAAFAAETEGRYWVTVKAADKRARTKLLEGGFDIVEIDGDKVSGVAGPELLGLLSSKAFGLVSKTPLAALVPDAKDFPSQDSIYHNYQETYDLLKQLADANSDLATLFSIGKTVEGRDIWCLRLNSSVKGEGPSSKPGAFFMGNLHAREHLTTEVSVLLAAWLLEHRNDADVKRYLSTLDIYIAPMANPDGSEYDIRTGSYQYYRKNMAKNADKSRGVDLNRNFDSWWCEAGASNYPGSDTYCGPRAFSEPESVNLKRFFEGRRNLRTHITYHSYASEILYPWGGNEADVSSDQDKRAFIKIAAEMGKLTNYEPRKSSDMYVATGDSADWVYAATGALAFTFELEGRGFYPGAAIVKGAVERNIKAAVYLLSVTDNPYKVI